MLYENKKQIENKHDLIIEFEVVYSEIPYSNSLI